MGYTALMILWATPPLFPFEELQQGLQGHCLTVFEGDAVEAFDFEVKGLMKNQLGPSQDVVLVKLLGSKVQLTGVVAGMSGSPCYIDNKLLGALGYSYGHFSKEPMAGITPILSMLDVFQSSPENDQQHPSRRSSMPSSAKYQQKTTDRNAELYGSSTDGYVGYDKRLQRYWQRSLNNHQHQQSHSAEDFWLSLLGSLQPFASVAQTPQSPSLQPLVAPISLAGGASSSSVVAKKLQQYGLEVATVASGASGSKPAVSSTSSVASASHQKTLKTLSQISKKPVTLQVGDPISVVMAKGDLDLIATGTLTYIDGNRLLAFGHPFMSAGRSALPIAKARIVHSMALWSHSYKVATLASDILGIMTEDRTPAIAADTSLQPEMFHLNIKAKLQNGKSKAIHIDVAVDDTKTPGIVAIALYVALSGQVETSPSGLLRSRSVLTLKGFDETLPPLVLKDCYSQSSGGSDVWGLLVSDIAGALDLLWNTPWQPLRGGSLDLEVAYEAQPSVESIADLYLSQSQITPGEDLQLQVLLQKQNADSHDSNSMRRQVSLNIPIAKQWRQQSLEILALSSSELQKLYYELYGAPTPQHRQDILQLLADHSSQNDTLYIAVLKQEPSLVIQQKAHVLPPSVSVMYKQHPKSQRKNRSIVWQGAVSRAGILQGKASASLNVKDL